MANRGRGYRPRTDGAEFRPCPAQCFLDSLTAASRVRQMRYFGLAILGLCLFCSSEGFANLIQTSKGPRLSIIHQDPADGGPRKSSELVAEKGDKEKPDPRLLTKTAAPKGKVKVQSVANDRANKKKRSWKEANPVAFRKR